MGLDTFEHRFALFLGLVFEVPTDVVVVVVVRGDLACRPVSDEFEELRGRERAVSGDAVVGKRMPPLPSPAIATCVPSCRRLRMRLTMYVEPIGVSERVAPASSTTSTRR